VKPERARVLIEGFIAGLIGYAVVVIMYAGINLISGRSIFFTAALLGRGLVVAPPSPSDIVAPGPVLAYNGVHLIGFLVIGTVAAWLALETERYPHFFYFVLFIAIAGLALAIGVILLISEPVKELLPWRSVVAANLAAALAIGWYLSRAHPRLWNEIKEHADPEEPG